MLGATHMIAGASIYKKVPYKIQGYILAFLSHFFLDAIPHHELSILLNYELGILAGLFLLIVSWYIKDIRILLAAFLGAFPDINWILKWSTLLAKVHSFFHSTIFPPPYFLMIEVLIIITSGIILLRKSSFNGD